MGFSLRRVPLKLTFFGAPLLAFRASPESHCSGAAASGQAVYKPSAASSLAVPSPSAYSRCWPATYPGKEPLLRLRCLPSVSHAPKASIRPTPASHVKAGPALGVSPSGSLPLNGHPAFSSGAPLLRFAEPLPSAPAGSAFVGVLGIAHRHVPALSRHRYATTAPLQGFHPVSVGIFGLLV